jgi:hypothetical protein
MARSIGLPLLMVWVASVSGCHEPPARVDFYKGWNEALFLEAPQARVSARVVPEIGGRIVSFSLGDENILFENQDYLGKSLANTKPGAIAQGYIGYNVDLGPELRGIPSHLALWMGPHAWTFEKGALVLSSAADPSVGVRLQKEVSLDPRSGTLDLIQRMKNVSESARTYCLWDRTLCRGGGFAMVALNSKSRFKAGWSLLKTGKFDGDDPRHPAVTVLDGVLVVHATGEATKLGADPDTGWIAYVRGKLLFIKYFPIEAEGRYSDGGNFVEIYFDPKVCELEPLSPEVTLRPGEEYSFPEKWVILELDQEVTSAEQARSLLGRIPASPFKQ